MDYAVLLNVIGRNIENKGYLPNLQLMVFFNAQYGLDDQVASQLNKHFHSLMHLGCCIEYMAKSRVERKNSKMFNLKTIYQTYYNTLAARMANFLKHKNVEKIVDMLNECLDEKESIHERLKDSPNLIEILEKAGFQLNLPLDCRQPIKIAKFNHYVCLSPLLYIIYCRGDIRGLVPQLLDAGAKYHGEFKLPVLCDNNMLTAITFTTLGLAINELQDLEAINRLVNEYQKNQPQFLLSEEWFDTLTVTYKTKKKTPASLEDKLFLRTLYVLYGSEKVNAKIQNEENILQQGTQALVNMASSHPFGKNLILMFEKLSITSIIQGEICGESKKWREPPKVCVHSINHRIF